MKNCVTDSDLGKIYCKSDMFGRVKKLEIEGRSVKKNSFGAYEYTFPDGKKVYFGLRSGFFKGTVLNYNGRKIWLLSPLKAYEVALAFSGIAFLILFCYCSAYFGVFTINPVSGWVLAVFTFGFGDLSSLPIAQSYAGAAFILSFSAALGFIIDLAAFIGCFVAYVAVTKRVKPLPLKILSFIICYGAGVGVLCGVPYIVMAFV